MKQLAAVGRCSDRAAAVKFMQLVGASRLRTAVVVLFRGAHHFCGKYGMASLSREESGNRLFTLITDGEDAARHMHKSLTASMTTSDFRDVRMVTS